MELKNLNIYEDSRGTLIPINDFSDLPFVPQRMFTVMNVPKGQTRGDHAHYKSDYLIFCLAGEITATVTSASGVDEVILGPGSFISHKPLEWGNFRFNTGEDIMMVLCSTKHDDNDYITNYEEFMKMIGKKE